MRIVKKSSKIMAGIVVAAIIAGGAMITVSRRSGRSEGKIIFSQEVGRIDMDGYSKPYGKDAGFSKAIAPFFWVEVDGSASLCLNARERFLKDVFATRSGEGFRGSGDDWTSLASVFLEEKMPECRGVIDFDPETGMFCAFSGDADALAKFALAFRIACGDDTLIRDLFSRAKKEHVFDERSFSNEEKERILSDILNKIQDNQ